ncbi:xylose isomerase-like protein [Hymenopellis radicata]|nr:xylose isomerase-like protein [Hymenopellis radicata]
MSKPNFAIASLSLGSCLYHSLPTKLEVAASLGYDGLEIFIPDFEAFVDEVRNGAHRQLFPKSFTLASLSTEALERECAKAIAAMADGLGLSLPLLQPIRNFENFRSEEELQAGLDGIERWLKLMEHFRCDLVLVCSNYVPGRPITEAYTFKMYLEAQVHAFTRLGNLAAGYNVRIGYEPLAWGTVIDNWEQVWEVVRRVDLPNVGIILDSFNSLGNQYADPGTASSVRVGQTLAGMVENLEKLSRTIPGDKIFIYQLADAVRPAQPVSDGPDAPRRMTWSRASRVFPCEPCEEELSIQNVSLDEPNPPSGYLGFLPVVQMTKLVQATGYAGWWSLEVFNKSLLEEDEGCTWRHGRRGIDGLNSLWEAISHEHPSLLEGELSESDESLGSFDATLDHVASVPRKALVRETVEEWQVQTELPIQ